MFRCRNVMLTPTPSERSKMLAGPIKEWTFERWVYQCITFCRGQDQDRVQGPGSPLKSDAWNWTITSAGGCWLGTCSPALLLSSSAQHPRIKLTFSDEDEIIVGLYHVGYLRKCEGKCRTNTQQMTLKWKRCIVIRQAVDKLPCSYLQAMKVDY